jgi:uncharacterized membrane protein
MPSSMMPIFRMVLLQNLSPVFMVSGRDNTLAMIMPTMMAIMIALTGLLANPNTDTPNQSAR